MKGEGGSPVLCTALQNESSLSNNSSVPFHLYQKNGSHYRASEFIPYIFGVFKKIERRGRQNKNNRTINLHKVIAFSTDYKYTT